MLRVRVRVCLRARQALFEAAVRLQMTDSRVLSETCAQLGGALSHDLPAAAILRRPEVTLALLSLLRTSELAELGELRVSRSLAYHCNRQE